jgi:hypothetical protein
MRGTIVALQVSVEEKNIRLSKHWPYYREISILTIKRAKTGDKLFLGSQRKTEKWFNPWGLQQCTME